MPTEAETAELFWTLAADRIAADPRVAEGTLMGGRCLRADDEFVGMPDYEGHGGGVEPTVGG